MTDRYRYLTVVLEQDVRSDDAAGLISAIGQLRGVLAVTGNVADPSSYVADQRARADLTTKLWDVLHPKTS